MFDKSEMLYLYVESSLHAGTGASTGVVDLPIQRERVTGYPMLQASGIKGKLRARSFQKRSQECFEAELARLTGLTENANKSSDEIKRQAELAAREQAARDPGIRTVFGPESGDEDLHAGALSPGDARLLLFPVRSLAGVFAWTTSRLALERLYRDLVASDPDGTKKLLTVTVKDNGNEVKKTWQPVGPDNASEDTALVVSNPKVVVSGSPEQVVLEEFAFTAQKCGDVDVIAKWLADKAFPQTPEYDYFRTKVQTSLVILPEDAFRDFTRFATEIVTRVRIEEATKTVANGQLWTEERLPSDSLLYAPLYASAPRTNQHPKNMEDGTGILDFVRGLNIDRLQLGGNETIGRGVVKVHFGGQP